MKWMPHGSDKAARVRVFVELVLVLGLLAYVLSTVGLKPFIQTVRDTPAHIKYIWYHQIQKPTDFKVDFYGLTYLGRSGNILDDLTLVYGAQEKPMLFFLKDTAQALKKPDLVFYDIGANVGQHTLFMSQIAHEVHAFEPYPPVLERLKANVQYNRLNNVLVHEVGLGDLNTQLPFYEPPTHNSGAGGFVKKPDNVDSHFGSLRLYKGDDWIRQQQLKGPDLIKCDIEGYEKPALIGLHDTLRQSRPIIVMEVTTGTERAFTSDAELMATLPENYALAGFCDWDNASGRYRLCGAPKIDYKTLGITNIVAYPIEKRAAMPHLSDAPSRF